MSVYSENLQVSRLKYEEMDLDQMRLFTILELGDILEDANF